MSYCKKEVKKDVLINSEKSRHLNIQRLLTSGQLRGCMAVFAVNLDLKYLSKDGIFFQSLFLLLVFVTSLLCSLGVPSVSDPHEAIHGDLNEQIKIGEAVDEDKDDYENWKKGRFICEVLGFFK